MNTMIRTVVCILCMCGIFVPLLPRDAVVSPANTFAPPLPPGPGQPGFGFPGLASGNATPEQQEKEMAQLMQTFEEIEKEIAKLSPEEREQFDKMVEGFGESLMNMSDDQFQDFLSGKMTDEQIMEQFGHVIPEELKKKPEEVTEHKPEGPQKKEITVTLSEDHHKVDDMLKQIINKTASLQRKVPSDIAAVTAEWVQDGMLHNWSSDTTWADIERDIESMIAQMSRLRDERDQKRKRTFLEEILKNKPLNKQLAELLHVLEENEEKIEETTQPFVKTALLSKPERNALITIMDAYAQSLYKDRVPQELETVLATYAAEEEKIKKEGEDAIKAAKRANYPYQMPAIGAGVARDHRPGRFGNGYGDHGYGGDYSPSGYYRDPYSGTKPSASATPPSDTTRQDRGSGRPLSGKPRGATDSAKKETAATPEQPATKPGEAAPQVAKRDGPPPKTTPDRSPAIGQAFASLDAAAQSILSIEQTLEKPIADHIKSEDAVSDKDTAALRAMNDAIRSLIAFQSHAAQLSDADKKALLDRIQSEAGSSIRNAFSQLTAAAQSLADLAQPMSQKAALYMQDTFNDILMAINRGDDISAVQTALARNMGKESLSSNEQAMIANLVGPSVQQPEKRPPQTPKLLYEAIGSIARMKLPDLAIFLGFAESAVPGLTQAVQPQPPAAPAREAALAPSESQPEVPAGP